jgi:TorA maturation chaperone TorD
MEMNERIVLTRQALYRFYAALLLYPDAGRNQTIRDGARWLLEELQDAELARAVAATDEALTLLAWARDLDPDGDEMSVAWVRLFGSSIDGFCYPYEGAYGDPAASGQLLAHLQREYARAGLAVATTDLPDHVSVELEYLSHLCGLELETLRSGEDRRRQRIVKAQRLFLRQHLTRWLPTLLEQVVENDGGTYALICQAASQLAERESERLRSEAEAADAVAH